jgi:hypothetical protein
MTGNPEAFSSRDAYPPTPCVASTTVSVGVLAQERSLHTAIFRTCCGIPW